MAMPLNPKLTELLDRDPYSGFPLAQMTRGKRATMKRGGWDAVSRDDTHYSLGSVLNHVLLHQTIIGLEAKEQLALAGDAHPDVVIGCCGGGSNLSGIALPFVPEPSPSGIALIAF